MRKIDTARSRELLDQYGDEAAAMIAQLVPLVMKGKISEALVTAATYLEAHGVSPQDSNARRQFYVTALEKGWIRFDEADDLTSAPDISPATAPR